MRDADAEEVPLVDGGVDGVDRRRGERNGAFSGVRRRRLGSRSNIARSRDDDDDRQFAKIRPSV